jgi:hypothetical protein
VVDVLEVVVGAALDDFAKPDGRDEVAGEVDGQVEVRSVHRLSRTKAPKPAISKAEIEELVAPEPGIN